MKKIRVNYGAIIGNVEYIANLEYELEDELAETLIGAGFADELNTKTEEKKTKKKKEVEEYDS